ncbi:fimbrial biogenesis outer membrane usher protein [Dyella terrae]|nr:fimbrial biogenesis outer membrane usher protein [Dyella terrae]
MPFGADLLNEKSDTVGMVGQGGQLFVRGAEDGGTLLVRWGSEAAEQCHVSYQLSVRAKEAAFSALENVDATCR